MEALVLHAVGDARFEEIPLPRPGAGQVRVRVGFCGVCGSDLPRVFTKGTYRFPTVCGHEFAGVVAECGPGVTDWKPGDRVAVFPLLWCGKCEPCEKGRYAQCEDYDYLGSRSDGAFAESVVVPERNLIRVPEGVSLEEAAMTEPAAVALHALRRAGGCDPSETVAIFGAGPIGVMVAQWARAMGAARILLFDLVPQKLELAKSLGFKDCYRADEVDAVETVNDLTGGRGAEVCIEAAGFPATLLNALAATRRNGRMVLLGNPSRDVTLPAPLLSQAMRREIQILGTWNSEYRVAGSGDDWHTVLGAMESKRLDLLPLVTHRVALPQAMAALEMMKEGREFYSKVLIHPS
jgi:L-iditol 2-dehydrogenase